MSIEYIHECDTLNCPNTRSHRAVDMDKCYCAGCMDDAYERGYNDGKILSQEAHEKAFNDGFEEGKSEGLKEANN